MKKTKPTSERKKITDLKKKNLLQRIGSGNGGRNSLCLRAMAVSILPKGVSLTSGTRINPCKIKVTFSLVDLIRKKKDYHILFYQTNNIIFKYIFHFTKQIT